MKLSIRAEALEELTAAFEWYAERDAAVGQRLLDRYEACLELLHSTPRAGTRVPEIPTLRRLLVRGFPFSVVYLVKRGEVLVVAFAHMKRRPGYWRRRAP